MNKRCLSIRHWKFTFSAVAVLANLVGLHARAEDNIVTQTYNEVCPDNSTKALNKESCVTIGASTTASAGSAMYAARKFGYADGIEAKHTKVLASFSESVSFEDSRVNTIPHSVQDHDRVTVNYHLSEERNRAYHVDLLERNASSADSSASMYRASAIAAAMPRVETYTDANGRVQTRTVPPNLGLMLHYNNMADQEIRKAAQLRADAHAARNGASVPLHQFEKVIENSEGNRAAVLAFFEEEGRLGSSLFKIRYLPGVFAKAVGGARILGGVAVGAAVISAGVAIEEGMAGKIAEEMRANQDKY